ncbi:PTS fructose transporter subunit IIB [Faecalicatena contorta]|jgi:PTS system fructose-specific IIB component|uniref:PTS system, fructose-specific IIB component n=1 Tax=Faecalicatena contorta TaxID=39482 RepID=A0A315ZS43_9FIRM|nr:PTS fructose transporter subunit IIB [Faecalicatena contorta]MBA4699862.1 PTS fructose transporter subunit IIB [Ruminococcus sp.]PWJ47953.1 PTS system fructose-specific IIB component [Faecalicatena contorta]SUQ15716.1 PTS system, fructose-specific IIB component [Faecalicatena contorta]
MKIIGITACPTGIAHTYMAQECLERECKKRGFEVKIETQGGLGIENELTEEDVASADVVILAVSVVIEGEERFEGKPIINTDVDEAISKVAQLVDRAVALAEGK